MFRRIIQFFSAESTGMHGERLAAEWLQRERRFRLVARNWRSPRDRRAEIDLVAEDGSVLVFIEVKTRAASALVTGYYSVNRRKKNALRRAVKAYLVGLKAKPQTVRFDIVEVLMPADGADTAAEIRHFANIPLFSRQWRP